MFGSWVSKVLCLIPDSFSSLGLSHKRTCVMHEKLFRSCSYPFGHWSALNTPCYLCGWASSLSASDVLLLSEEELVHHCHHVSVQINKMFVVPPLLLGGSSSTTTSRGSHVTNPIMHLMLPVCCPNTNWCVWLVTAAYILLLPQCIMGRSHGTPPWTDWLTDKHG